MASAFLTYIALLVCYTVAMNMMFGILAYMLPKKADVQGIGTFLVLLSTLFGGFIVSPNVSEIVLSAAAINVAHASPS